MEAPTYLLTLKVSSRLVQILEVLLDNLDSVCNEYAFLDPILPAAADAWTVSGYAADALGRKKVCT